MRRCQSHTGTVTNEPASTPPRQTNTSATHGFQFLLLSFPGSSNGGLLGLDFVAAATLSFELFSSLGGPRCNPLAGARPPGPGLRSERVLQEIFALL